MAAAWLATPDPPPGADGPMSFAEVFQRPTNRAEVMINRRDGPAFAQLATDLALERPEGFHDHFAGSTPEEELSYRAGRPLMAWMTWALSAGAKRALLAPALMALTLIGMAGVVAATGLLAQQVGRAPSWAWAAVLLPGLGVSLWAPGGCEPLATALVLFGWVVWRTDQRVWLPVLLWSLAGLTRETTLIVPIVLALVRATPPLRRTSALLVPASVYGAWLLVVWQRTGQLPSNAGGGRVSQLFGGFVEGVAQWDANEWVILFLIIGFGVAAMGLSLPAARGIAAVHIALASSLGHLVWEQGIDFSRIFVLVEILGLLAIIERYGRGVERPAYG